MTLRDSLTAVFFRPPRQSRFDWFQVGFGLVIAGLSVGSILVDDAQGSFFSVEPAFLLLGLAFILIGGAELLPESRRRQSGVLRIAAIGAFFLFGAAIFPTV